MGAQTGACEWVMSVTTCLPQPSPPWPPSVALAAKAAASHEGTCWCLTTATPAGAIHPKDSVFWSCRLLKSLLLLKLVSTVTEQWGLCSCLSHQGCSALLVECYSWGGKFLEFWKLWGHVHQSGAAAFLRGVLASTDDEQQNKTVLLSWYLT